MEPRPEEKGMYRQKRLEKQRSSYGVVIAFVAAFAVIGWLWFLFASGYWDISSIQMDGLTSLDRGEVVREIDHILDDRAWRPWHSHNLLMLDGVALQEKLKDRLFVDDVTVDKTYPDILRLSIKERQRSVVIVSGDRYVNVDATGLVTGDAEGDVLKASQDRIAARAFADEIHLPVIVMQTADPLVSGFQVARPEEIRQWLDMSRAIVLGGLKIRFMKIEAPDASLMRVVSERGYDIYFDLKQSIDTQIQTYQAYMRTKPDETKIKEYLDVRVPGKVFVK